MAVKQTFHGRVIKIYETTTGNGAYTVQIDDAVGTGNTLHVATFDDNHLRQFSDLIRQSLAGLLLPPMSF